MYTYFSLVNSHLKALTIGSCPSRGHQFQNHGWLHGSWNPMLGTGHNEGGWGGNEARIVHRYANIFLVKLTNMCVHLEHGMPPYQKLCELMIRS